MTKKVPWGFTGQRPEEGFWVSRGLVEPQENQDHNSGPQRLRPQASFRVLRLDKGAKRASRVQSGWVK